MKELTVTELFDLDETIAGEIFEGDYLPLGGPAEDRGVYRESGKHSARGRV